MREKPRQSTTVPEGTESSQSLAAAADQGAHGARSLILVLAAVILAVSVDAVVDAQGRPRRQTRLSGVVADPVTGDGVAASVVMGSARHATSDGRYRVRVRNRRTTPFPAVFSAPGYSTYETWAEAGVRAERDIYLLPINPVDVPGYSSPIPAPEFREHFDALYRSGHGGRFPEGLARWVQQPVFSVVDRVLRPIRSDDGRTLLRATSQRVTRDEIRNLEGALAYVPDLTGGLYSGDSLEVMRMRDGEELDEEAVWPEGGIQVMVLDLPSNSAGGGAIAVDGVLVSGQITLRDHHLRSPSAAPRLGVLVHEIAHALGMRHGAHPVIGPSVPLCSVMGNHDCRFTVLSPLDVIVARMAYARLPGNGLDDRDPDPTRGPVRRGLPRVIPFDGPGALGDAIGPGYSRRPDGESPGE